MPRAVPKNFGDVLREKHKCRCGHEYTLESVEMRDVPAKPIDGIPTYDMIPICPACGKPVNIGIV